VRLNEFFTLHEHTAAAAAGVEYATFVWLQHFDQQLDDTSRRIELAAFLAFRKGKLAEEVFINTAEYIVRF
jgi:hypothetical protein